ncbi:MAG: 50S ribosomal protein L23 [Bdellovibrionales bacterium]|nr:50S ribosomal protein L23 [Bdellovibrionales bacterium]
MGSTKTSKFDILRTPRITEKSATLNSMANCVVFDVHPDASKRDIKHAVESIFDVTVRSVRTANCMGKVKRVRTHVGRQAAWKKAYVYLAEGSALNVVEGL